jgi:hypothetical protein
MIRWLRMFQYVAEFSLVVKLNWLHTNLRSWEKLIIVKCLLYRQGFIESVQEHYMKQASCPRCDEKFRVRSQTIRLMKAVSFGVVRK